jgi:MYXO-CTERM domain-containing protein
VLLGFEHETGGSGVSPARVAFALAAAFAVSSLAPKAALANGRFPNADHLVVDPGNPDHVVVRATFGIVQTFDAGATWTWLCEPAVGYGGTDDPAVAVTGLGNILVGIRDGVATSFDSGCVWNVDGSALAGLRIADLATDVADPSIAIGISADDADGNPRVVVAETLDDGASWTALGPDLGTDLFPQTIDAAPSMRERLYVSAVASDQNTPVIERSSDRGASWTRIPVNIAGADRTFISAISPTDPDVVYLRVPGEPNDRLFVSTDAAETWTQIVELEGDMLGFALSPDGSRVAVGMRAGGIHVASTGDHVFSQVGTSGARCLTWSEAGLYACGNEAQDGFTVGRSADGGATFTPLYHLLDVGLIECPAGTDAGDACPSLYGALLDQLGNPGGSGGGSAGSTASGSTSTGGAAADGTGDDGCDCNAAGARSQRSAALALALATLAAFLRHRRKSRNSKEL